MPATWRQRCRRAWRRVRYFGHARQCPICDSRVSRFLPFGTEARPDAQCPFCGALERHRLAWLYFQRCTDLFSATLTMIHFAPEPEMSKRLGRLPNLTYISTDLYDESMLKTDIHQLAVRDDAVDVIYCSHVLNMIPDDRRATRELYRVLKPDGWALIQGPVRRGQPTIECPEPVCAETRLRTFGDRDMYRVFGDDVECRLEQGGFRVRVDGFLDTLTQAERTRYGLRDEELLLCGK